MTIQLDLLEGNQTFYTIWLDQRMSYYGGANPLTSLSAVPIADGLRLQQSSSNAADPVLQLKWNGSRTAPVDLCGFYVGITNPLFVDPDNDGIPQADFVDPSSLSGPLERTWLEAIREVDRRENGYAEGIANWINLANKYDGGFNYMGTAPAWLVPSKRQLVEEHYNKNFEPGIYGLYTFTPGSLGPDEWKTGAEVVDSDADFLPDAWELKYFSSLAACDPKGDPDGDFIPNSYEFYYRKTLNPIRNDYVAAGDFDGDGMTNAQERTLGFNYWEPVNHSLQDPDGDGVDNLTELTNGTNPFVVNRPENPSPPPLSTTTPNPPPGIDGDSLNQWLPNGLTRDNGPLNDADGDGVKDDEDAVPYDKNLTFAPVPESRYIVIPIEKAPNQPEDGVPVAINDLNQVLLQPIALDGTDIGSMKTQSARFWRGPGQREEITFPQAGAAGGVDTFGYLPEWDHSPSLGAAGKSKMDLAKDAAEVLAHALWKAPSGKNIGVTQPSEMNANVPALEGPHAFLWQPQPTSPAGGLPARWLPYTFAPPAYSSVPHFDPPYGNCPASIALNLLGGGRIAGSALSFSQTKHESETDRHATQEGFSFFSWIRQQNTLVLDLTTRSLDGTGWTSRSTKPGSDWVVTASEYDRSLEPFLVPEQNSPVPGQARVPRSATLSYKMLTWKQRGLLQAVPHQAVPKNNQTPEVEDVSHLSPTRPPWMEENGGYGPEGSAGSGGGSSDLRTRYYYKEKVWAETATPPVYLIHSTKVPPVSLNDMPDQRAEKDSLGYTENDHTYVHPYSTGPLIVGDGYYDGKPGSTYWVQKPASPAGNTEFTGGTLTARPAVPAVDEDHPAKPAIPFIPHGGKEHMNGQSQFDQGDGRRYINNRGEVLGHIYGDPYLQYHGYSNGAPALWRNGRGHNLDDLTNSGSASPAYENIRAQAINDKGVIAAMAYDRRQKVRVPVVLFPIEIKAFKRGTLNAPGAQVRGGTGEFGFETVMMENGDSESAANSTGRDCEQTGNLNDYRKTNDDDLVKVVLKFPINTKISGASLKLIHEGMQVDATKATPEEAVSTSGASRLKFYKADGELIPDPDTDLQIPDLANPPADRYLSKIATDGEVTIFIEGADKFGDLPISKMARLGGALLKWEFQKGENKATEKLLVYRGGFLRYVQPAGAPGTVGTLEFRDGKGRVKHEWGGKGNEFEKDETDMGNILLGASWTAKSGKTRNNPDRR